MQHSRVVWKMRWILSVDLEVGSHILATDKNVANINTQMLITLQNVLQCHFIILHTLSKWDHPVKLWEWKTTELKTDSGERQYLRDYKKEKKKVIKMCKEFWTRLSRLIIWIAALQKSRKQNILKSSNPKYRQLSTYVATRIWLKKLFQIYLPHCHVLLGQQPCIWILGFNSWSSQFALYLVPKYHLSQFGIICITIAS